MTNEPNIIGGMIILILLGVVYFLPSIVALSRGCQRANGVIVVNAFLGWTLIFWVLSLAWAVSGDQIVKPAVERHPFVTRDQFAVGIALIALLGGAAVFLGVSHG